MAIVATSALTERERRDLTSIKHTLNVMTDEEVEQHLALAEENDAI